MSNDAILAPLSCFMKMLRPSVYFVDGSLTNLGAIAQSMSRGRWALAHTNKNLKTVIMVST